MPRAKITRQQQEWESGKAYRSATEYGMAAEFSGWVDCTLTQAHRTDFDVWLRGASVDADFQAVSDAHYRLSVGEDLKTGGYVASAFMRLESSPQAGKMTSQRSSSPVVALYKLIYAIRYVMPTDWTALTRADDGGW